MTRLGRALANGIAFPGEPAFGMSHLKLEDYAVPIILHGGGEEGGPGQQDHL